MVSLVEPGDRVLVLSNRVYGQGFADYAHFVGGEPVVFSQLRTQLLIQFFVLVTAFFCFEDFFHRCSGAFSRKK